LGFLFPHPGEDEALPAPLLAHPNYFSLPLLQELMVFLGAGFFLSSVNEFSSLSIDVFIFSFHVYVLIFFFVFPFPFPVGGGGGLGGWGGGGFFGFFSGGGGGWGCGGGASFLFPKPLLGYFLLLPPPQTRR